MSEEMQIEEFNPTKAQLLCLAETAKGLVIKGVKDVAGYQLVHETRIKLKNERVSIQKQGKAVQAAKDEAEQQRQALIKEQADRDRQRIEAETRAKLAEEKRQADEKAAQEKLEKEKNTKHFLQSTVITHRQKKNTR